MAMTRDSVDPDMVKRAIVQSLFSPAAKGSAGQTGQAYSAHCKIWEDIPGSAGERKPRYILLAVGGNGQVFLHKSKRNTNGSFSIGKTWDARELKGLELADDQAFRVTLGSRTYLWITENAQERIVFLQRLVRRFHQYTGGDLPTIKGFTVDLSNSTPGPPSSYRSDRNPRGVGPPPSNFPPPGDPRDPRFRKVSEPAMSAGPGPPRRPQNPPPLPDGTRPRTPNVGEPMVQRRPSAPHLVGTSSYPGPSNGVRPRTPAAASTTMAPDGVNGIERAANGAAGPLFGASGGRPMTGEGSNGTSSPNRVARPRQASGSSRSVDQRAASPPTETPRSVAAAAPDDDLESEKDNGKAKYIEPIIIDAPATHDILKNVEEMLEGFEWRSGSAVGGKGEEQIESRLLSELQALEAAEIHAIIENDDRVETIVKHLDEAMAELERMDLMLSLYKTQLNTVADDITHIESQNRGLQVQTSNQRALLQEIEQLMQTIRIPKGDLDALEKPLDIHSDINRLEEAATNLYKALLSTRDGNFAAAAEQGEKYRSTASSFSKQLYEFLLVMFKDQADLVLNDKANTITKSNATLPSHELLEKYLERYCGLTLFVKEMDNSRYQQLCVAYFTTASELHKAEIASLLGVLRSMIRRATEGELESTFAAAAHTAPNRSNTMRKSGSNRGPLDRDKDRGMLNGREAFSLAISSIGPHILREQNFIADFLHLHPIDTAITFADYMSLEGYFKRSASAQAMKSVERQKDLASIMELIFGFLPAEIKQWHDWMLERDQMQVVGILAALDDALLAAEAARNDYLSKILRAQHRRSSTTFEKIVKEQLKAIEQTKLTVKKRKGVVSFIRIFPDFVQRIEMQLADVPPTASMRRIVSDAYAQTIKTMFEALQTMARSDEVAAAQSQDDRDKGRLNFHTLIIENMHHFVTVVSKLKVPALKQALEEASAKYEENLSLYIRLILRRPLGRLMDHFQGIEQLLRTTPASEVSMHSQFGKPALKRVVGSMDRKDLRKATEALAKRVDKHFNDLANPSAENSVVMETVWKACEAEVLRLSGQWRGLIDKCYSGDDGTSLEYTKEDVQASFSKYRPGV